MSLILKTSDFRELSDRLNSRKRPYVVVEGYNAVGKSVLMEKLCDTCNFRVYRPSYDTWANAIPREYRWAIFGSFMNVSQELGMRAGFPVLFDRGFFSGVVYNNDLSLAEIYPAMVGSELHNIIYILITCSEEDYEKFLTVRNSEKLLTYSDYLEYTERYRKAFEIAGVTYIEYQNIFDSKLDSSDTCSGCSHYSFHNNSCHNLEALLAGVSDVSPKRKRCQYSSKKEVQDSGTVYKMCSLSK